MLPFPDFNLVSIFILHRENELAIFVFHPWMTEYKQAMSDCNRHPAVIASIARRINHFESLLGSPLTIAKDAVFLDPHGRWKDQVSRLRCRCGIDVRNNQELVLQVRFVIE